MMISSSAGGTGAAWLARGTRRSQMHPRNFLRLFRLKWVLRRQKLVKEDAERVDIDPCVDGLGRALARAPCSATFRASSPLR